MGRRNARRRAPKKQRRDASSSSSSSSEENAKVRLKRLEKRLKRMERTRRANESRPAPSQADANVIPVFDPQNSAPSINTWVNRMDMLAEANGWSDATVVNTLTAVIVTQISILLAESFLC
ncbi:hypothetical protein Zmor_015036 [Zophobas morio]|uniref:Uncharacterized protein n=1 Tax=Zophobas morio TaxID=2755281 RepID=A0AA38MHJ0_9CUCU|nr:hypothetical protein Zmor_015036 [Zophobas morio]